MPKNSVFSVFYGGFKMNSDNIILIAIDILMAISMLLLGLFFFRSKGKAADFLAGYNTKRAAERRMFDEKSMCREYGKFMMLMSIPFILGAVIDFLVPVLGCALAWAAWIILLVILMVKRVKKEGIDK